MLSICNRLSKIKQNVFITSCKFSTSRACLKDKRIGKVLIANRGEIACRIIRTAREMGIKTVAVYSDADKHSLHVKMADEAYYIGPSPSIESYLKADTILDVAKRSGSHAIHPGYGFLSENVNFAKACDREGITFIGPPASAIRDMGIKSTSKAIMIDAGVPVIHGYHGNDQAYDTLFSEAEKIGFPVMIKAVMGGGGKGMRLCNTAEEFEERLASAKREAMKSFGDEVMLIEKFVTTPRHVEVQVFGDEHGNYVYLFERDCSVQRRHQKIIEEAPAPGLSEETRQRIGEAAVKAAQAVNYVGAGTVEFIMDKDEKFYFMEMNTRLQVEHPVTEMITSTDLVQWQIKVASGEPLPLKQSELRSRGHSFEARIYAENCSREAFLPSAGHLAHLTTPEEHRHLRIDTGVRQGDDVSVYYDPMIAKLVVWDEDRQSALNKLSVALNQYNIVGVPTNIEFLKSLVKHENFKQAKVHTGFIDEHNAELFPEKNNEDIQEALSQVAISMALNEAKLAIANPLLPNDPFNNGNGFRLNSRYQRNIEFIANEKEHSVQVEYLDNKGEYLIGVNGGGQTHYEANVEDTGAEVITLISEGRMQKVKVIRTGNDFTVFSEGEINTVSLTEPDFLQHSHGSDETRGAIAPMPGVIEKVYVTEGQEVKEGDPMVVMIAMKMEYVIKAPKDGKMDTINYAVGETVNKGDVLVNYYD